MTEVARASAVDQRPVKVLIIGQTPPPIGGQIMMIDALVRANLDGIDKRLVRMAYSRDLLENSVFKVRKVVHLFSVIGRSWLEIARFHPDVVYYPPSGNNPVPMVRDVITLLAIRPFTRRLVLHFHPGGTSDPWVRGIRSRMLRALYHKAFFGADLSIQLAPTNKPDGQVLQAKRVVYVANGLRDMAGPDKAARATEIADASQVAESPGPMVLYAGANIEPKGIVDLVTAGRVLWDKGIEFRLDLLGHASPEMAERLRTIAGPFVGHLTVHGLISEEEKWELFGQADIFCFPSWFEAEGAPLVICEAMMFGLPVVSTTWRAIPDLVTDEETGRLVTPHDTNELAEALSDLIGDPDRRRKFGSAGRKRFDERFSLQRHLDEMRDVLIEVGRS